jgi:hypothetical protein
MESTLVLLLGTTMSTEGQMVYEPPVRWMLYSSEWARKARLSINELPYPVGYGANRAPRGRFVCEKTLSAYHEALCHTFKTIFDG